MTKRLLSVGETAEYLAVSKDLLYRMAASKQIPHVRILGRVLFDKLRLDELVEKDFVVEPIDWSERLNLKDKL